MENKVKEAIAKIRPLLQRDGGDIEFVALEGTVVKVKLRGACSCCPMSQMTLKAVVEKMVKADVPSITKVETV